MSDFFDRLEGELRGAVARSAAPESATRPRPSRRRAGGGLVVALASGAAIAVAVIAIGVTGHGGSSGRSSSHESACTRKLFAGLGVLRRPQTAADRAFQPPPLPEAQPIPERKGLLSSGGAAYAPLRINLVPSLTRLARTLPGGRRVFLVVYAPPPAGLAADLGDEVWAYLTTPGTRSPVSLGSPLSGAFLSSLDKLPPLDYAATFIALVPDGVARVVWTFPRQTIPSFKAPGGRVFPGRVVRGATLVATVSGNVAAVGARHPVEPFPSSTTWLAADGHVIAAAKFPGTFFPLLPRHPSGRASIPLRATATGTPLSKAC